MRIKKALNHFALKFQLIIRANQAAMREFKFAHCNGKLETSTAWLQRLFMGTIAVLMLNGAINYFHH